VAQLRATWHVQRFGAMRFAYCAETLRVFLEDRSWLFSLQARPRLKSGGIPENFLGAQGNGRQVASAPYDSDLPLHPLQ
jgi:hypothetical protein